MGHRRSRALSVSQAAADAELSRAAYCTVDYYALMGPRPLRFVSVPKDTVPSAMGGLFQDAQGARPAPRRLSLDRTQFYLLDGASGSSRERNTTTVYVHAFAVEPFVAAVNWQHTGFGVVLNALPMCRRFAFTQDAFLDAVHHAKWQLELFFLPLKWPRHPPELLDAVLVREEPLGFDDLSLAAQALALSDVACGKRRATSPDVCEPVRSSKRVRPGGR